MLHSALLPAALKIPVQTSYDFQPPDRSKPVFWRSSRLENCNTYFSYKREAFQKVKYKLDLTEQPYLDKIHSRQCLANNNCKRALTRVGTLCLGIEFTVQSSPWHFFPAFRFLAPPLRIQLSIPRAGLNGVNRQPSKTEYFYRQPSNERAKISRLT